jgi:hypothetical protein
VLSINPSSNQSLAIATPFLEREKKERKFVFNVELQFMMAVTGRKKKKSDTSLSNTIRWNVNGFGPDNGLRPNSYRLLTISTLYFNRCNN